MTEEDRLRGGTHRTAIDDTSLIVRRQPLDRQPAGSWAGRAGGPLGGGEGRSRRRREPGRHEQQQ
eukprot:6666298-Pyramimonas_sp.AAC.1